MKKVVSLLLLMAFFFGVMNVFPDDAYAARKYKKKRYYRVKRKPAKTHQKINLSPQLKETDMPRIESDLKEKGVTSVKFDTLHNILLVQYSSQKLSMVDIIQLLKEYGYFIQSID